MFLLVLPFLASVAAVDAQTSDPLAITTPDWKLCYSPDTQNRTCRAMTEVRKTGPDTYFLTTRMMAGGSRLTLEFDDDLQVENGTFCSNPVSQHIQHMRFLVGDLLLPEVPAAEFRSEMLKIARKNGDISVCSSISRAGDNLFATTRTLRTEKRGKRLVGLNEELVSWVHNADGYTLSPA